MAEEKRHEMMETLFGSESEGSEDEPAVAARPSEFSSEDDVEGGGEADAESEGERAFSEPEREESEAERAESEAEGEASEGERGYNEGGGEALEERYPPRDRIRGRHQISASDSEQSHGRGGGGVVEDDDEVEQVRESSEHGDEGPSPSRAADMRDVFGDSEEEEEEQELEVRRDIEQSPEASAERAFLDDEAIRQKLVRPDDAVADEEEQVEQYDSEEEQPADRRTREKPVAPPLELEVPLRPPPAEPEKMHIVRVSNIMGIEPKPFDPKTYTEEEIFVTDEAGQKQRLRLEDNVARWRIVRNRDGTFKHESNARFVKWSDGSMQLLIGNEVLDTSVKDGQQDQAHLFVRHGKGVLQAQGRLLRKIQFMPSSLSSKSHRLLTALVDSRHRKIYKVKNVITNTDPEREKEEKEKAVEQKIRSREDLQRRQEKINRKYTPVREREPQLSPGYLEGALEEEEEADDFADGRRTMDARRFQDELEAEGRAERRIINAKKQPPLSREPPTRHIKERQPPPPRRELEDSISEGSDREPSEYETDHDEVAAGVNDEAEEDDEREEEPEEEEEDEGGQEDEERGEERGRKRRDREEDSEDEESPHQKPVQRRRVVVSDSEEED